MANKSDKEKERNRDYQAEYYEANRDDILSKRKQKYENDPDYRARMRARDQRNYWFRQRPKETVTKELPNIKFEDVSPKGHIELKVKNKEDARDGQTIRVPVYGTTELAKVLDRDPQTLRKWLQAGVIPEPATRGEDLPDGHPLKRGRSPRLYTEDEARTIFEARDLLALPYGRIKDSLFAQSVRESLGDLVQGLEVQKNGKRARQRTDRRITGKCPACEKAFVGMGDPTDVHYCRSCGFEVEIGGGD